MPLPIKWSHFNKDNVSREAYHFGVYELGNSDDILYIGEGKVKARLMAHFSDGSDPIPGASFYRVEYTGSKDRAVQRQNAELASYKRKHGKYPRFNQRKG
ncbi:excinuclease ABC subunit C [Candidatus Bathyarchaeota archaeon]|nr:excinuclease ABC subunit C [Candidatus Bathyarchaeota archaeon]